MNDPPNREAGGRGSRMRFKGGIPLDGRGQGLGGERQPRAKLPFSEAEAFRNTYLNNPILTGKDRDSSK